MVDSGELEPDREALVRLITALPRGPNGLSDELCAWEAHKTVVQVTLLSGFNKVSRGRPSWGRNFEQELKAYGEMVKSLHQVIGKMSRTAMEPIELGIKNGLDMPHPVGVQLQLEKIMRGLVAIENDLAAMPPVAKGPKEDRVLEDITKKLVGIYQRRTGRPAGVGSDSWTSGPAASFIKAAYVALGIVPERSRLSGASQLRRLNKRRRAEGGTVEGSEQRAPDKGT